MHNGFDLAKTLYNAYFPYANDAKHLKNMGYMLQLIYNDCDRNFSHCVRVSNYAMMTAEYLDISAEDRKKLWSASIIHDIGKMYISKGVLMKPGGLTDYEFKEIKCHAFNGYYMAGLICDNNEIALTILDHHERYDGKGYPKGKMGKKIPFLSRILSVADAFDAMSSERVYKNKMSFGEALEELRREKDKQFDGQIVDAFADALEFIGTEPFVLNASPSCVV